MMKWIKLAVRNILRNKRRSLVTLLAIGVGFAAISLYYGYIHNVYNGLRIMAIRGEGLGHLRINKAGWHLHVEDKSSVSLIHVRPNASRKRNPRFRASKAFALYPTG